jgi:hypothetical protein
VKSESRGPKAERSPKPEVRSANRRTVWIPDLGFLSGFGFRVSGFQLARLLSCGLFLGLVVALRAEESSNRSARVQRLYLETHRHWRQNPTNTEAAWKFARACFDSADVATNDNQRASIAEQGIAASRRAIELQPKSAAAHYYLGLNLGQLAQTKLLGALRLIGEMEAAWHRTLELDPKFDYAGAHRSLTLLYRDAPGWPTSVGSRTKARRHLEKAVALWPDYPGNQLCLLESQLKWGESKVVQSQIPAVDKLLQEARAKFSGEEWARDWQEWDERWHGIKAKAGIVVTRSPHHPE